MEQTPYASIALIGKVASGKETQARHIIERFGGTLYSNGNKARSSSEELTVFGKKVKAIYESGALMPEWLASYWMVGAILHAGDERIVFEGVAKKPNEAELFHEIHTWIERPYIVFHIKVSDETVYERSTSRGRDVLDTEEGIRARLLAYREHTESSIAVFTGKGTLIEIDGERSVEDINKDIMSHLART
jgi:adenylate kinase